MICKCTSCGEMLTQPIFHNGSPYGYSCIKKVNPDYKKSKTKTFYVKADSFELEFIDENTTKITAKHFCSEKKFYDFQRSGFYTNGLSYLKSDNIKLYDGEAYIDLMKYKNSSELILKTKNI
jgi:hypothetical protein